MADISEGRIIALLKSDRTRDEGFTLLMHKYQQRLYWHARRLVVSHENAQDVVQESFINVYKYLHQFNEESKIYTWLYRITTNECLRLLKKQKKRFSFFGDSGDDVPHPLADNHSLSGDDIQKRFQKAISTLPEKQRLVFNLRYYDEMPYEQMSEVLDTSVGSLKTSYHYASEKLKELLSK